MSTQSKVLTASGAVKAVSGEIFDIHVTKVGTGASSITIYDNPSAASGTILWQGDGLSQGDWACGDSNGTGLNATTGIFVALAGTTNPTVVVTYQ